MPADIQTDLFNTLVVPVVTYGCKNWGDTTIREIELLHMKFMKHVLYVHKYTSTDMVYGELEVYPLEITIKCKMIHFWARLVTRRNTKLSYVMYNCLLELHRSSIYTSPWLDCIKNICIECGMAGVWMTQTINNITWFRKAVEQKLRDIWITTWYGNVTTKGICNTYRLYKEIYEMEKYLVKLNRCNHIYVTKFHTGNNQLPVITGRHHQINREERYCTKCNERKIGDEFHMLLQCQHKDVVQL